MRAVGNSSFSFRKRGRGESSGSSGLGLSARAANATAAPSHMLRVRSEVMLRVARAPGQKVLSTSPNNGIDTKAHSAPKRAEERVRAQNTIEAVVVIGSQRMRRPFGVSAATTRAEAKNQYVSIAPRTVGSHGGSHSEIRNRSRAIVTLADVYANMCVPFIEQIDARGGSARYQHGILRHTT